MTDDHAGQVRALLLEERELGEPHVATGRRGSRWRARSAATPGPTARWTRSSAGETHGLSVPISPKIPGRTPVSPTPTVASRDQLVRQVVHGAPVDAGLRRVVGRPVPAAAHDDVQAGARRPARAATPDRDPSPAGVRSASPLPPAARIAGQFLQDDRLVAGQLPVVPARLDVPQGDLGVLVGQGEPEASGGSGRGRSGRAPWRAMLRRSSRPRERRPRSSSTVPDHHQPTPRPARCSAAGERSSIASAVPSPCSRSSSPSPRPSWPPRPPAR